METGCFRTIIMDDIDDMKIMGIQYMAENDFLGIKAVFFLFMGTVFLCRCRIEKRTSKKR